MRGAAESVFFYAPLTFVVLIGFFMWFVVANVSQELASKDKYIKDHHCQEVIVPAEWDDKHKVLIKEKAAWLCDGGIRYDFKDVK